MAAIEQLEAAVAEFTGTLVLVSHDLRLVEDLAMTHRWHLDCGRVQVEVL